MEASLLALAKSIYYIITNEIPGELSPENMISSHVKRSLLLWLHNKSRPSQQKAIERFHMTSRRPYWCSKTMKRQPSLVYQDNRPIPIY